VGSLVGEAEGLAEGVVGTGKADVDGSKEKVGSNVGPSGGEDGSIAGLLEGESTGLEGTDAGVGAFGSVGPSGPDGGICDGGTAVG
jgi:hypothetical protein